MGTKVRLTQTASSGGYTDIVEMDTVPREGESICFNLDSQVMTVRTVIWVIDNPNFEVIVNFR